MPNDRVTTMEQVREKLCLVTSLEAAYIARLSREYVEMGEYATAVHLQEMAAIAYSNARYYRWKCIERNCS